MLGPYGEIIALGTLYGPRLRLGPYKFSAGNNFPVRTARSVNKYLISLQVVLFVAQRRTETCFVRATKNCVAANVTQCNFSGNLQRNRVALQVAEKIT